MSILIGSVLGLSIDSRSADKELKVVTSEKKQILCHRLYQKSRCQDTKYSIPELVTFYLNKPNRLKCKKYFIFQKSKFWFFVTWSAGFESKLKPWSGLYGQN